MIERAPQLTFRGPVVRDDAVVVQELAGEFSDRGCVVVPGFLASPVLAWVQRQIADSHSFERKHGELESTELTLDDCECLGVLAFMVNDPVVFNFVERVTGRPSLSRFFGRVYSRVPGRHRDEWHDDLHPMRLAGMSINLSTGIFGGGLFEIRDAATKRPLGSIANTGFGDAIFFAIDDKYEHRVSPLNGDIVKSAYAGWFGNFSDYNQSLRRDPALTHV